MNRKFRVWDIVKQQYRHPWNYVLVIKQDGTLVSIGAEGVKKEKECTVEFHSGKMDKDDSLLYEHDIVSYDGSRYVVSYHMLGWVLIEAQQSGVVEPIPLSSVKSEQLKRVGNINKKERQENEKLPRSSAKN